jgi:hypothetical protein
LRITGQQADRLGVIPYSQISPHLENCCLRLSAVVSYEQAALDIAYLTGIRVPAKTQQRLVHRHDFTALSVDEPLQELAVDGGTVRLRTPLGEICNWRNYKAIVTDQGILADFQNNQGLIDQVNQYPLALPLTCLGDGHDGIWNIIEGIATVESRREVLDWYHLKENLYKISMAHKRLKRAETCLWQGNVEGALALLQKSRQKQAQNFCSYLRKHQARIINYEHYQAEGICSIGSGMVESGIKQINRRVQLSGAQWNEKNVPQVLAHRCAYLNKLIGTQALAAS